VAFLISGIRLKQAIRQQKNIRASRKKKGLYCIRYFKQKYSKAKNSLL
jgi:hypothetical protein